MRTPISTQSASLRLSLRGAVSRFMLVVILVSMLPVQASASTYDSLTATAFDTIDDAGNGETNYAIRFGSTLQEELSYSTVLSRFIFSGGIKVLGGISGSLLKIDNDADIFGRLAVSGSVISKRTLSGQNLIVSGAASFSGGVTFKNGAAIRGGLSGASLRVSGPADIHGALAASGSVRTDGDLTLNDDRTTGVDTVLTFGNATVNQTITFLNTKQKFQFSKSLSVVGSISGSSLTVDGVSSFSGAITAMRDLNVKGTLSGAFLIVSGASSFSGSALFRANLSVKGTLSGSSFIGAGLGDCNNATTSKLLYNNATGKFSCGTDQTGGTTGGTTGGGLGYGDIEGMFVNQGGDTMTGGLTIDVTTADVVKTTTGNTNPTDFSKAGATLTNVTDSNDMLTQNSGTVPSGGLGTWATSSIVTTNAIGTGSLILLRDDGQYIIVNGNNSTTTQLWDGIAPTMTRFRNTNANVGKGAIALKRPDGRYVIVHGNSATTSSLFDPKGFTATAAGPTLTSCTARDGTNAFLAHSGSYILLCGGTGNWGTYNAVNNTYLAGAALSAVFGPGAHALQRGDGTFLVFSGNGTSSHFIYNSGLPVQSAWTAVNPIPTNAPTIHRGATSIRRPDGKFLIIGGAANASTLYDPTPTSTSRYGTFTPLSGAGLGPTAALRDGAQTVWRQDGKFLMLIGSGSTATNIVDVTRTDGNMFVAGPTIPSTPGVGMNLFMDGRGYFRLILGGGKATATYDTGYIRGGPSTSTGSIYESECITAALQSGSYLTWKGNADDMLLRFQVKTGKNACSGTYKYIQKSGDLIRPTSGDNRIQIKVTFERDTPRFASQEWGLRRGISQVQYRRMMNDPAIYEIAVRNVAQLHRTQFDFGNSTDPSGPLAVNIVNNRDKNLQIQLANMVTYPSTVNPVNANFYNGAFSTGASLPIKASIGTIVMKRPDGKYTIVVGTGSRPSGASSYVYTFDPVKQTFQSAGTTVGAGASTGALAFKRPDGKFFLVMGGNTTETNIYDPVANTFTKGPAMRGRVAEGSNLIPMPNGQVLILHGGFKKTTTLYDPLRNTMGSGALSYYLIGRGSIVIPKPNGTYFVIPGTSTNACALQTATMHFDPYANRFFPNPNITVTTGTGPGAFAFERSDGQWVILKGGATATSCAPVNSTHVYNPFTNRLVVGPVLRNTATRSGGQAMQRPDGSWLVTFGGGTGSTTIYYEKSSTVTGDLFTGPFGTFIPGPTANKGTGSGSVAFQRDDGKFQIIAGDTEKRGSVNTLIYDAGWVAEGYYRSAAINVPDLDSTSTLTWKSPDYNGISAQVRTGTSALTLINSGTSEREISGVGGRINPNAGETFVQVQFSFRRTFPASPSIGEDVWWNGGTTQAVRWRDIKSPTITEFSIGKDQDILNLSADTTSLFRIDSSGDVYTGTKGALYSGGADLAERYRSDDRLVTGELVSIDYADSHSVRRATHAYQPELLGVVSTNPGFVAGAYTPDSYPIALLGRVPVNVTLENGPIRPGDRITSSSLPGWGMKATQKGRVVGFAIEGSKAEDFRPCAGNSDQQCGHVMMFVNLRDWAGAPVRGD